MTSSSSQPTEKWADVGELRMRYLDWGGDGTPVLALHGLASCAHWYDLVAPELAKNHRVIAPDQRGHGQTTQAPTGYDWPTLASDVASLMSHLDIDKFSVLGHSWGGNVAINLAADYPNQVSSLVMIDGGFFGARLRNTTTWEEFQKRRPRDVSGTREQFLDRIKGQLRICWNEDIERIVQTMVWEDDNGQINDILTPDNHDQVMHAMWHDPASGTWPRIESPTLIVAAGPTPDRIGSEFAVRKQEMVKTASQEIKNSQVHWVPETIHDIGYHKPVELAETISDFLAKQ
jgi:pimeloyl-ACP methyl ester carboxylesterase